MSSNRHRRSRIPLLWLGFFLAAVGMGVAVNRLYETVRREITDQGNRALQQAHARTLDRVRESTDLIRQSTIEELAAFHLEGLGHALRQWNDSNATIVGVFQWDSARGFLSESIIPENAPTPEELVALWQDFREWRAEHPRDGFRPPGLVGDFRSVVYNTLDASTFPATNLGYQVENLEILRYAGRDVDPWAGWAAHVDNPESPWVFWYQPGPDAVVRGCFVDVLPVVELLRSELGDRSVAQLDIVPDRGLAKLGRIGESGSLFNWLPAYTVTFDHGEIFLEKQSNVRLSVLIVALLFGLFLLGVAFLSAYSRREARDAERKTTFVSQVSHELRTPLTSIRMFADMLGEPGLSEEKRAKFAGTISRESKRLGALIERLLTFNALEKGKVAATIESVDVTALVVETLEEMEATLSEAGMRAESDMPAEAVFASTDRSAVKQVLLNLIDNAIKYARSGEVVHVSLVPSIDRVNLRVADRGPGVPRNMQHRAFEPFVQAGQTLTDKSPGVGLGLSIARELLRASGGDLVLISSPAGATFEMRLPNVSASPTP